VIEKVTVGVAGVVAKVTVGVASVMNFRKRVSTIVARVLSVKKCVVKKR
jgi:hypothetical protein